MTEPGLVNGERWRPCPGFEGLYEVSSMGRIRRVGRGMGCTFGRIRRPWANSHGYPEVVLHKEGRRFRLTLHILVCQAFHGPPPTPEHEVGHKNGNRADPRASNLEWTTRGDNHRVAYQHGRKVAGAAGLPGEANHAAKLTAERVQEIRHRLGGSTSILALAAELGVHQSTVRRAASGRSWASVD